MRSWVCVFAVSVSLACSNPQQTQPGTGGGQTAVGGGGGFGVGGGEGFGGGFQGDGGGEGGGSGCFTSTDVSDVTSPQKAPPPISGGTMAVLADGTTVIGDSDRDQLHFIGTDFAVRHVQLLPGDEPGRVIVGPGNTVFVSLRATSQIAQVDATSGAITRLDACSAPRGLAWKNDVSQLLVACSSGELATLDFSAGAPVKTLTHPVDDLRDVLVLNGQTLVTTFRSAQVFAVNPDGTLTGWSQPPALTSTDGTGRQFTPQVAWRTVASSQAVVMLHQVEEVTAIPAPSPCVSTYGSPEFSGQPTTLSVGLTLLGLGTATDVLPLPAHALPVDVAYAGDGARIAIAYAGANTVFFQSPSAMNGPLELPIDGEPVSVAFSATSLLVFSREPARLFIFDDSGAQTAELPLSTVSMKATGHELFHQQTQNGIACASCHPEAGEDGHVWSLPEGVRRTPTLRGGLIGTEPFHWSGEEPNMDQLMSDIFVARMGGMIEPAERTAALLQWIDVQPARPVPGDLDASAVTRGQAKWSSLGCVACHSGALGTNNSTVDVGTGELLQVPRLKELAYRAPYFHDGRIATLADRFTGQGGTGHTATSGLTADEISDLVAYLKSR